MTVEAVRFHRGGRKRPPEPPRDCFGVYVHVPFCSSRCHYCDFVTYTGMEGLRRPYAAALLAEADLAVAGLGPGGGPAARATPSRPSSTRTRRTPTGGR